jgi:thiosulfate dehydrogenase
MKKMTALILIVLFLGLIVFTYAQKEEPKKMEADPAAELAKSIENGKKLFSDTSLGTSGMTCNSCHMEGGTKEGKMGDMTIPAWDNLAAKYPKYFGMAKKVMTLDQVNNWCIMNPLKGKPLAWDDQKLTDLTAYVASVKKVEKKK